MIKYRYKVGTLLQMIDGLYEIEDRYRNNGSPEYLLYNFQRKYAIWVTQQLIYSNIKTGHMKVVNHEI